MNYPLMTALELRDMLARGDVSPSEIVRIAFAEIEKQEPRIHAFVEVFTDRAVKRANELEQIPPEKRGPLWGVPVAIKDNLCLSGKSTTCASKILEGFVAPYTATAVKALEEAGTIIIGRTNMDEFAMGSSCEHSIYGQTRNPWKEECVPGGSSGGSAAAVASGEVPLALGSDTGGSIRQPAAFCGAVGLKPTYGRVSRYGLVAFASSLDQIGPIARNVGDAALLLKVISGHDQYDSTSLDVPVDDFSDSVGAGVRGMKIGLPQEYFGQGLDTIIKERILSTVKNLEEMGAGVEEISLPHTDYAVATYYIIAPSEASANLARFDGIKYGWRSTQARDLREQYAETRGEGFGIEVKRRIMLGTYALSAGYYDAYYLKAQKVRTLIMKDFHNAFKKVDAIITPTTPTTAFSLGEKLSDPLQMYLADVFTIPVNLAGLPAVSVPAGWTEQCMPIGLQVIGPALKESNILKVARAVEQIIQTKK